MKNLPIDLLMKIFPFLVQRDQLECMTVCRQWHDIIHHYCLFRTIYIHSEEQIDQLIERVKRGSNLGTKVERLTIELSFNEAYDTKTLIALFPNLRHFDLLTTSPISLFPEGQIQLYENHPWCERIKTMTEEEFDLNTRMLLLSGICTNLTRIAVGGIYTLHDLVKKLINAPALKMLYLNNYELSFHNLELLHETSLKLHTLSLQNVCFINITLPLDIKPATSVKTLLYLNRYFSLNERHLLYISRKYTQVENLKIDLRKLDIGEDSAIPERRQREEVVSYFKKIGPQLKTFSLSMNPTNIDSVSSMFSLSIFNECGARNKTLELGDVSNVTLFYELVESIKANDIQSLSVYQAFESPVCFRWLLEFTVLKELTLGCSGYLSSLLEVIVNLRDLVSNLCNTRLETLRLDSMNLRLTNPNEPVIYPWLKDITLFNTVIQEEADTFISRSFPNLKHLKLKHCHFTGTSFELPNIDLFYLEIEEKRNWSYFPIMLTTLRDNQSRLYKSRGKTSFIRSRGADVRDDIFTLHSTFSVPLSTTKERPMLTVVCRSVYSFIMKMYNMTTEY